MTRKVGDPPWAIMGDTLVDSQGTHLFRLLEQPGLGHHAEEILAQIVTAPELLDALLTALPYVEDAQSDPAFRKGVVCRHALQMRGLIARTESR